MTLFECFDSYMDVVWKAIYFNNKILEIILEHFQIKMSETYKSINKEIVLLLNWTHGTNNIMLNFHKLQEDYIAWKTSVLFPWDAGWDRGCLFKAAFTNREHVGAIKHNNLFLISTDYFNRQK